MTAGANNGLRVYYKKVQECLAQKAQAALAVFTLEVNYSGGLFDTPLLFISWPGYYPKNVNR